MSNYFGSVKFVMTHLPVELDTFVIDTVDEENEFVGYVTKYVNNKFVIIHIGKIVNSVYFPLSKPRVTILQNIDHCIVVTPRFDGRRASGEFARKDYFNLFEELCLGKNLVRVKSELYLTRANVGDTVKVIDKQIINKRKLERNTQYTIAYVFKDDINIVFESTVIRVKRSQIEILNHSDKYTVFCVVPTLVYEKAY